MKRMLIVLGLTACLTAPVLAAETPPVSAPATAADPAGVPAAGAPDAAAALRAQAEKGDPQAEDKLAMQYANRSVNDFPNALKWWRKAAEHGNPDGEYQLGHIYYEGLSGEKKDLKEGCKWFVKSADQDIIAAEFYAGLCYGDGVGLAKSHGDAYFWLLVAKKHGWMVSPVLLDKFSKDLTPADADAVKARVRKWFVAHPLQE